MSRPSPCHSLTYTGFVESTYEAAILFHACIQGLLRILTHRSTTTSRGEMVKSGQVFIFEEKKVCIYRCTDDITWNLSPNLDGFLLYH